MNIFLESVAIIFASYIIFGGKKSAITLIALIGLLITIYLTNKHLFALEFSRICSLMRRAISKMKPAVEIDKETKERLKTHRKIIEEMADLVREKTQAMVAVVEIDKETEEQQQERLEQAERKITDFFTNKLEGETKKSDDKEKAIDLRDYNIFEESENKEKEIYLVEYSYRWYLGLRAKNIFEEEMDVLQDFLNHIWNCYGVFSAKKLLSMLCIEIGTMNIRYNTQLFSISLDTISLDTIEILIDNIKQYNFTQNFYSYHNKRIGRYLPTNVALKISDNGLYEIVRVGAFDGK